MVGGFPVVTHIMCLSLSTHLGCSGLLYIHLLLQIQFSLYLNLSISTHCWPWGLRHTVQVTTDVIKLANSNIDQILHSHTMFIVYRIEHHAGWLDNLD